MNSVKRFCIVYPNLTIRNAADAIEFYQKLFHAESLYRVNYRGKIMHAEILIGCSILMITDEIPELRGKSATTIGDTPVSFYLYVEDVDAIFERAIKMGCQVLHPVENAFYGDRMGAFRDPFGFEWTVAKHIEDVPDSELIRKMREKFEKQQIGGNLYLKKYLKYKKKYEELLQQGGQDLQVEENLAQQRRMNLEGFNKRNWDIVNEVMDENITLFFNSGEVVHGREAAIDMLMKSALEWAPDTRVEHHIEFGSGNWTALNLFIKGTFIKEWIAPDGTVIKPTDRQYSVSNCALGRWENGKLIQLYVFGDMMNMLGQLGISKDYCKSLMRAESSSKP